MNWILTVLALVLSLADAALVLHVLVCVNRLYKGLDSWSKEIDKANFNYIKQEFARLRFENGLVLASENENKDNG